MKLFIYCAGGFGRESVDLANRINLVDNRWSEISFIDDDVSLGNSAYGKALFTLEQVLSDNSPGSFEVSISNGEPYIRKVIYSKLKKNNIKLATLIDKSAIISDTAKIGEGVTIPAFCFVSSSADISSNVTLNASTLIGHDVIIGENSVISSAVNIAGNCSIGAETYIGMGVQVKQGITIGSGVIIGMGAIVHNDISDGLVALGNPARAMKRNIDQRVFNKPTKEG